MATRDRLLELQQRSGGVVIAPAGSAGGTPAVAPAVAGDDPVVVAVPPERPAGRPARLLRLLRRPAVTQQPQPQPQQAQQQLLAELAALQQQLTEARAEVEEVSRQQCRQLTSPRHQQQAWEATQRSATAALGKLGRIKKALDNLQQKLKDTAPELTATQAHMIQIQINSTRTQLLGVVQHFNEEEMSFRQKKKEHLKRQLHITGADINEDELENLLDQGDTQVFNESILMRVESARSDLRDAEERYEQIRALETSIEQLHEMFLQLSLLVQHQGEMIDRIEDNTIKTVADAERGNKELASALEKQKKGRKMKIICGIIVAVLIGILIIILISYLG